MTYEQYITWMENEFGISFDEIDDLQTFADLKKRAIDADLQRFQRAKMTSDAGDTRIAELQRGKHWFFKENGEPIDAYDSVTGESTARARKRWDTLILADTAKERIIDRARKDITKLDSFIDEESEKDFRGTSALRKELDQVEDLLGQDSTDIGYYRNLARKIDTLKERKAAIQAEIEQNTARYQTVLGKIQRADTPSEFRAIDLRSDLKGLSGYEKEQLKNIFVTKKKILSERFPEIRVPQRTQQRYGLSQLEERGLIERSAQGIREERTLGKILRGLSYDEEEFLRRRDFAEQLDKKADPIAKSILRKLTGREEEFIRRPDFPTLLEEKGGFAWRITKPYSRKIIEARTGLRPGAAREVQKMLERDEQKRTYARERAKEMRNE